ncbi:MAG: response regulator [Candidatus Zixiibacteriota bacterium]
MPGNILIVDDDDSLRLLYKAELTRDGYTVETASNAEEALQQVSRQNYALAIVDIEMPGMSGLELLGKLRQAAPDTCLVVNSAYSTYKADFNSWLADRYVVKSSDLEPLKQNIRELMVTGEQGTR